MQGLQVVSDTLDSFALGNVWAAEPVSLLLCPDLTCRVIYIINSATLPKACRHNSIIETLSLQDVATLWPWFC